MLRRDSDLEDLREELVEGRRKEAEEKEQRELKSSRAKRNAAVRRNFIGNLENVKSSHATSFLTSVGTRRADPDDPFVEDNKIEQIAQDTAYATTPLTLR